MTTLSWLASANWLINLTLQQRMSDHLGAAETSWKINTDIVTDLVRTCRPCLADTEQHNHSFGVVFF